MALQLKASLDTSDCLNLLFSEQTGVYTSSNTTGWQTPNPDIANATSATLTVTTPSGSNFVFSLSLSGFPTFNANSLYSIPYSSLGFSSTLEDGIYTAVYDVIVDEESPVHYTVTIVTFITCNLECCIDTMLSNIDNSECDSCNEEERDKYLEAFSILQQIKHSIECGDLITANSLSNLGNKLCRNIGCSTCK